MEFWLKLSYSRVDPSFIYFDKLNESQQMFDQMNIRKYSLYHCEETNRDKYFYNDSNFFVHVVN